MERHEGEGGALFSFSKRYGDYRAFNRALNIGLKEVGEILRLGGLTFYTARHSFATIAANAAGLDVHTIGEMLCHVDGGARVTEGYIKRDWQRIAEAAARVLAVVLNA